MEIKDSGCGILPNFESEEFSRWWNECEERNEQRRKQEAEEAKQEAAGQEILDRAEAMFFPWLKHYLEAENATTRITPKQKSDFKSFQEYCEKWGLIPQIPAAPQMVATFLLEEGPGGVAHVSRLLRSISTVHRAVNQDDPTDDILVRAVMRFIKVNSTPEKVTSNEEKAG
jgi:hypothetical protein